MATETKALIALDFINEIIHPDGKLSGKGYAAFDAAHNTLDNATKMIARARKRGDAVIHVRVGFLPGYPSHPENSPLFGAAKEYGVLQLGTWGTEFHDKVKPEGEEPIVVKNRVSAFHGTRLEMDLRACGATTLVLMGVATDMAVQAAARDAHDRDYQVEIIGDCCAAASDEDNEQTLRMLGKIAKVISMDDF